MEPEKIGPYRVEGRIGRGGMGEVLRAWDERLDRPVAIKRLRPGIASTANLRERLRREARAAAQLNHPAIVQIYDVVEGEASDCIVMELVQGMTLAELLKDGAPEIDFTIALAHDIAEGLAKAHGNGLIHRDLKPGNVIITKDGHAKILDFGIAKRENRTAIEPALTREGCLRRHLPCDVTRANVARQSRCAIGSLRLRPDPLRNDHGARIRSRPKARSRPWSGSVSTSIVRFGSSNPTSPSRWHS